MIGTHVRVDGVHPMFWKMHEHHVDKYYSRPTNKMHESISMIHVSPDADVELVRAILDGVGNGSTQVTAN